eukprot:6465693-Amphidinium_carterae.1
MGSIEGSGKKETMTILSNQYTTMYHFNNNGSKALELTPTCNCHVVFVHSSARTAPEVYDTFRPVNLVQIQGSPFSCQPMLLHHLSGDGVTNCVAFLFG